MSDGRRMVRVAAAVVVAAGLALVAFVTLRADPQPPIVLIVVDTLRADRLGCYGYPAPQTPNLDRFAAEGVRFERAYSPSSWTLPAVTSMLTGQMPSVHGVRSWLHASVPGGSPYLPEFLRENGYVTVCLMGNANMGEQGFGRGFDLYVEARTEPKLARSGLPLYPSARDMTDLAIEALDQLGDGRFFLYVHYMDTHAPYLLPRDAETSLADEEYEGYVVTHLEQVLPVVGRRYTRVYPYFWSKVRETAEDHGRVRALYDAKVTYADHHIGRLLDHLAAQGRAEESLVVITSDHGEGLFQHGIREHEELPYEHQVRIPLLVRGPGLEPGREVRTPVELVDLPLALAHWGASTGSWNPPRTGGNGQLRAALAGGDSHPVSDPSVVAEVYVADRDEHAQMASLDDHKLIRTAGQQLLFDLSADPEERTDLSASDPTRVGELARIIDERIGSLPTDSYGSEPITDPEVLERLRALGYLD